MRYFLCAWHIIALFPFLHKIVCNDPEIALEALHLFLCQIRDLEQIDSVIVYIRFQLLWNVHPLLQGQRSIPRSLIAKIQYQRHHWISSGSRILCQKLRTVFCSIVSNDTKRRNCIMKSFAFQEFFLCKNRPFFQRWMKRRFCSLCRFQARGGTAVTLCSVFPVLRGAFGCAFSRSPRGATATRTPRFSGTTAPADRRQRSGRTHTAADTAPHPA